MAQAPLYLGHRAFALANALVGMEPELPMTTVRIPSPPAADTPDESIPGNSPPDLSYAECEAAYRARFPNSVLTEADIATAKATWATYQSAHPAAK
jgi:hypothetical protein